MPNPRRDTLTINEANEEWIERFRTAMLNGYPVKIRWGGELGDEIRFLGLVVSIEGSTVTLDGIAL